MQLIFQGLIVENKYIDYITHNPLLDCYISSLMIVLHKFLRLKLPSEVVKH